MNLFAEVEKTVRDWDKEKRIIKLYRMKYFFKV